MSGKLRVHLAAAGLFFLVASTIALLWAFPRLLVYILLIVAAVIAYGALYLILAAWIDPKTGRPVASNKANAVTGAESDIAEGQPTAIVTQSTVPDVPAAKHQPDSTAVPAAVHEQSSTAVPAHEQQHSAAEHQPDSTDVQPDSPDVQPDSPEERGPAKTRTTRKKKTRKKKTRAIGSKP